MNEEEIKKQMDLLCDKIDGLCDLNDNCGGCPLNDRNADSVKAFKIIREEILK